MSQNVEAIAAAILLAGGPTVVANALRASDPEGKYPSTQAVCFWRDGKRRFPEEHGAALEALCGKPGTRWRIWPDDWFRIWPELIGTEGAPEIPAQQEG